MCKIVSTRISIFLVVLVFLLIGSIITTFLLTSVLQFHIDQKSIDYVAQYSHLSSQLYPFHVQNHSLLVYEPTNPQRLIFNETPIFRKHPLPTYDITYQGDEECDEMACNLHLSMIMKSPGHQEAQIIDPVLFKVEYLTTQEKWYEMYKRLVAIGWNPMLFVWGLQKESKNQEFFQRDRQEIAQHFNQIDLKVDPMIYRFLLSDFYSLNHYPDVESHTHGFQQYCMVALYNSTFWRQYRDTVLLYSEMLNNNQKFLTEGCQAIESAYQKFKSQKLCDDNLSYNQCRERIQTLYNLNSTLIKDHFHVEVFDNVSLGLDAYFKSISQDKSLEQALKELLSNQDSISYKNLNSTKARSIIKSLYIHQADQKKRLLSQATQITYENQQILRKALDQLAQEVLPHSIIKSNMRDKFVNNFSRYVTKLNLHYQIIVASNQAVKGDDLIYRLKMLILKNCSSFMLKNLELAHSNLAERICSDPKCSKPFSEGSSIWDTAFNYFLFPEEDYFFECPYDEYLKELEFPWCFKKWSIGGWLECPSYIGKNMKTAMIQYSKVLLSSVSSLDTLYCSDFKNECPNLIIAINQLSRSLVSIQSSFLQGQSLTLFPHLMSLIPQLNSAYEENFFFYEHSFFKSKVNAQQQTNYRAPDIYNLVFELQFDNVLPGKENEYLRYLFFYTQQNFNTSINQNPYQFHSHLLEEIKVSDPLKIGNPCLQTNYSLIPFQFSLTLPLSQNSVLNSISHINNSTSLFVTRDYLGVEYKQCTQQNIPLGDSPLFQVENSSLGYIVPTDKLASNSSLRIYFPNLQRVLDYDPFPCPSLPTP